MPRWMWRRRWRWRCNSVSIRVSVLEQSRVGVTASSGNRVRQEQFLVGIVSICSCRLPLLILQQRHRHEMYTRCARSASYVAEGRDGRAITGLHPTICAWDRDSHPRGTLPHATGPGPRSWTPFTARPARHLDSPASIEILDNPMRQLSAAAAQRCDM